MTIDISIVDRMNQRLEKAPSGKWYARTYDGATVVYEDEITGYTGGTIPSEINDVYEVQRTAVLLGGRQVVSAPNPITGRNRFSTGESPTARSTRLVTVACGNSIPGYNNYDNTGKQIASTSELHFTNQLAGAPMLFREIAPATRVDAYGIHSYGGRRCDEIITDIIANWFPALTAGGTIPDMVCIPDAIVNDITQSASVETCKIRLAQLIQVIRAKWPAVIIWLDTIRGGGASYLPGLPNRIVADAVCDWMVTLDDGARTFVTDVRGVWGDMGAADLTLSSDLVHPLPSGAMEVARLKVVTLRRISAVHCGNVAINTNPYLSGSVAASGNGVSGTVPTSCGHTAQVGTASTVTLTALNPGVRIVYTLNTEANLGQFNTLGAVPDVDVASGQRMSVAYRVRLISGAENLRQIRPEARVYYTAATGGGSDWRYGIQLESGNNAFHPRYKNGDVLDLTLPAFLGTSPKNIGNVVPYLKSGIAGGTSVTIEVDAMAPSVLS